MKRIILFFTLIFSLPFHSQTFVKYNPVPNFVGAINLGVETSISQKTTFSFDVLASPWDYGGKPRKFVFFLFPKCVTILNKNTTDFMQEDIWPLIYLMPKNGLIKILDNINIAWGIC